MNYLIKNTLSHDNYYYNKQITTYHNGKFKVYNYCICAIVSVGYLVNFTGSLGYVKGLKHDHTTNVAPVLRVNLIAQHEKTRLMYTKYTCLYFSGYLPF